MDKSVSNDSEDGMSLPKKENMGIYVCVIQLDIYLLWSY